jgi:hypothetical protein
MKRAFLEPHDFDEDAMPTLCMVCGGMFDLDDGFKIVGASTVK